MKNEIILFENQEINMQDNNVIIGKDRKTITRHIQNI